MTDLFIDYKKQNKKKTFKKTFTIVAASFIFALSVNSFLFGTETGTRLQTSVLNSGTKNASGKADIVVVSAGTGTDMLKLKTSTSLENVSKIYLSLAFDPESLAISDVFSADNSVEIVKNANVAGISSLTLLFKTPQKISKDSELATIVYKKKKNEKVVLNLAETQFKSKDGTIYELTNSPVEF